MVVHFPIALILTGFLFDLGYLLFKKDQCLSKAGFYLMVLGTLGAVVAFTSGYLFTTGFTEGEIVKVYNWHKTGALISLIILTVVSIIRIVLVVKKKEETPLKWVVFALYFLGTASVSFTGLMGGTMVYKYILGM
jgi:uncharacterized membrane protein